MTKTLSGWDQVKMEANVQYQTFCNLAFKKCYINNVMITYFKKSPHSAGVKSLFSIPKSAVLPIVA